MYIEKSIYIMFVNSGMKVWKREEQFMNNVKVQTKLIIVMLATIVALVLCAVISSESMKQLQSKALETLEADERASYDEQIKQQVDNVISLSARQFTISIRLVCIRKRKQRNWQQMRSDSFVMEMPDISGWISMTEPMWCF